MADDPYDNLDLQRMDDATYASIEPKKEENPHKILRSDIRQYGGVGVGVGLLCAALALLNIAVLLYRSNVEREQLQTRIYKLTEERDHMKMKLCELGGFTYGDGLCYFISTERRNWTESRRWCRDTQSDLIVIDSREKQDFVERLGQTAWLGLTDREVEGRFRWVDGTPLTTTRYWGPRQPDNYANKEDCVEFYDGSSRGATTVERGWSDLPCSFPNYWICEKVLS